MNVFTAYNCTVLNLLIPLFFAGQITSTSVHLRGSVNITGSNRHTNTGLEARGLSST